MQCGAISKVVSRFSGGLSASASSSCRRSSSSPRASVAWLTT